MTHPFWLRSLINSCIDHPPRSEDDWSDIEAAYTHLKNLNTE